MISDFPKNVNHAKMITTLCVLWLATVTFTPVNGGVDEGPTVETKFGYEVDETVDIVISRTITTDAVTFKVQTLNGVGDFDAIAPLDYTALPQTSLSFDVGDADTSVTVTLVDDGSPDPGEYFFLQLTDFSDGTEDFTAKIFIVDGQGISVNCPGYLWAREHDVKFEVTLRVPQYGPQVLNVSTQDIMPADENPFFMFLLYYAFGVTETAVEGEDYTQVSETLSYESGELVKTVTINITDDVEGEPTKVFYIVLTGEKMGTCKIPAIMRDDNVPDFFHCGRSQSQPCLNGSTCNRVWGICECPEGYGGPDCRLDKVPQVGCDDRCGEHGTCRSLDGDPPTISCECHLGWAGAFCNYTAYNVKCNKNSFGVCFTPYSYENFQGVIYVWGKRNVPECRLAPALGWPKGEVPDLADDIRPIDNDKIQSWCQGFAMELPSSGPCGECPPLYDVLDLWAREHDEKFEVTLRVPQYGPQVLNVSTQDIMPADENPFFMFLLYYAFGVTETAVEGEDYTQVSETLSYESGELVKTVTINITDDVGPIWRHEAQFITQYSTHIYTHLDEWVTLRCEFNGTVLVYEPGVVQVDSSTNFLKKQTSDQKTSPVLLSVATPVTVSGDPIPPTQRLITCVSVKESNFFDCVNIKRIDINNAKPEPDFETANLYDEGCVDGAMETVFLSDPAWTTRGIETLKDRACFTIKPFIFSSDIGQPTVQTGIVITAALPTDCLPLTCSPVDRKKREAVTEEELSFILTINLTSGEVVNTNNGTADGETDVSTSNSDKSSTSPMRPIIIGSAIGGGVFFVALIVALCFLCRRRDSKMHAFTKRQDLR